MLEVRPAQRPLADPPAGYVQRPGLGLVHQEDTMTTEDHRLRFTNGDTGQTPTGQPHGYAGMLLATCSCGVTDGHWFRAGATARIQGKKFMRQHARRNQ